MFSTAVSLKCRHLRDAEKGKSESGKKNEKKKRIPTSIDKCSQKGGNQEHGTSHETSIEEIDEDKENDDDDDHF